MRSVERYGLIIAVAMASLAIAHALAGCAFEGADDEGAVSAALSEVPAGVACVRMTSRSQGRARTHEASVVPGEETELRFDGLPIGEVELVADAFNQPCGSLTEESAPTWLSDPLTATITPGIVTPIEL